VENKIDPSKVRIGSIIKYGGSYWVAVPPEDVRILEDEYFYLWGWYWRKSDLPCPTEDKVGEPKATKLDPFFTCYVEGTDGGSHYKHKRLKDAEIEAERLANQPKNRDKKVYIMASFSCCVVPTGKAKWYEWGKGGE